MQTTQEEYTLKSFGNIIAHSTHTHVVRTSGRVDHVLKCSIVSREITSHTLAELRPNSYLLTDNPGVLIRMRTQSADIKELAVGRHMNAHSQREQHRAAGWRLVGTITYETYLLCKDQHSTQITQLEDSESKWDVAL